MMHVLDLDLDFFLADCCPLAEQGQRPVLAGHEPWSESEVCHFLEAHCGLSAEHPTRGAIFETHDAALNFWRDRMASGDLAAPFHVTHVDAHSDLGIGKPGPGYVLNGVLPQHPSIRADLERYHALHELDEANYLLFALAFRWVASLDNVRNPKSRPDIPRELLLPERTDAIRLRSFVSELMEAKNGREPEIPFTVYDDWREFSADVSYDFVTLAISPRYAPKEADALVPVIGRYISPI